MPRRRPDRAYVVCATPRSGSTLLCELLAATGVAGRPLEHFEVLRHSGVPRRPREYFGPEIGPAVLDRLPDAPAAARERQREHPEAWWRRILADGTTPNGVWAAKLMWGHVEDLVARARDLEGLAGADLDSVLATLLGDVRLLFVARKDKVAQAVSLWRAVQTQSWRAGEDGRPPRRAAYVFEGIDHLRTRLEDEERHWRRWFATAGRAVHEVSYDDLDADPRGTTAEVLHVLGLPAHGVPTPRMRPQRDEISARWAERYRAERSAPA